MSPRQAERVRSYLRGRLQIAISPVRNGGFVVAPKDGGLAQFYPSLGVIARSFNVTIPDSIMEDSSHAPAANRPD